MLAVAKLPESRTYNRLECITFRKTAEKFGGLSNMADIEALCDVEGEGVEGVICGRAIYSGDLDFAAAQARADELNG